METPKSYLGALCSISEVTLLVSRSLVSRQKSEFAWSVGYHLSENAWNIPHQQYESLGATEKGISEVNTSEGTRSLGTDTELTWETTKSLDLPTTVLWKLTTKPLLNLNIAIQLEPTTRGFWLLQYGFQ